MDSSHNIIWMKKGNEQFKEFYVISLNITFWNRLHESHHRTDGGLLRTGGHEEFRFYLQAICTLLNFWNIYRSVQTQVTVLLNCERGSNLLNNQHISVCQSLQISRCKGQVSTTIESSVNKIMEIPSYLSRSDSISSARSPCHKIVSKVRNQEIHFTPLRSNFSEPVSRGHIW